MKTATLIKNLSTSPTGATQALYLLNPPIREEGYTEDDATLIWKYVVVSAVNVMWIGDETYIFLQMKRAKS